MRLKSVRIKNFRCYEDSGEISIDALTAFVGKNDVGKSTVLEALDIFFHNGKGVVSIDKDDVDKNVEVKEFSVICSFDELPDSLVLDSSYETTLAAEYLTNSHGCLEVEKVFGASKLLKTFIIANHPTHPKCCDLLSLRNKDLKKILSDCHITCENQSINAVIRKAIRDNFAVELDCQMQSIDVSKGDDVKTIWGNLEDSLPIYSLFRSDRENSDSDDEVQNPLKACAKEILADPSMRAKLAGIAGEVLTALSEVATHTYEKLAEMAPAVAAGLVPKVPAAEDLKWADVFKGVTISGVDDIPINKRGSGVKRLVLLNFFRAEAERLHAPNRGIIYAIEEPETSQHSEHQALLVDALKRLSGREGVQVLITTHSSIIVKGLGYDSLRLVKKTDTGRQVGRVQGQVLKYASMIEASYLAFEEASVEYHDQLWAVLDGEKKLPAFRSGKPLMPYFRPDKFDASGRPKNEPRILSHYIRDQIHHPENTLNTRFTEVQLKQSIEDMRAFLVANP